jgi:outer membrane protein assembly factor BamB
LEKTEIYKKTVTTLLLALLIISSTLLIFSNSTTTSVKAAIPSNLLQYEWPQAAADSDRSNFNPGPGPTRPQIEWRTKIPTPLAQVEMVAFNGMVFVPDALGSTYALDAATGEIIYKLEGASGSVAKLDNTYMLIGSNCYEISDGSLVWTGPSGFSQSQSWLGGIGYTAELKMVLTASKGWSLANPAQPPTLVWDRTDELDYGDYGSEAIEGYGDDVIVVNTPYNYIRGVDATTGKTLWTTTSTISDWVYGSSSIDGVWGRGDLNGIFYGYNVTTGELMWTYNPGTFYNEFASASGAA